MSTILASTSEGSREYLAFCSGNRVSLPSFISWALLSPIIGSHALFGSKPAVYLRGSPSSSLSRYEILPRVAPWVNSWSAMFGSTDLPKWAVIFSLLNRPSVLPSISGEFIITLFCLLIASGLTSGQISLSRSLFLLFLSWDFWDSDIAVSIPPGILSYQPAMKSYKLALPSSVIVLSGLTGNGLSPIAIFNLYSPIGIPRASAINLSFESCFCFSKIDSLNLFFFSEYFL